MHPTIKDTNIRDQAKTKSLYSKTEMCSFLINLRKKYSNNFNCINIHIQSFLSIKFKRKIKLKISFIKF